jgi:hypothetical protein
MKIWTTERLFKCRHLSQSKAIILIFSSDLFKLPSVHIYMSKLNLTPCKGALHPKYSDWVILIAAGGDVPVFRIKFHQAILLFVHA